MKKKELTVTNALGIHARPASMIVKAASQFSSTITIQKDDVSTDAKSIMGVMMLAAAKDAKIVVTADGKDEDEAIEALASLFARNFNED
jgi:phosphocarrier protein